jgi:elongation factor P hydroxylase
MNGYKPAQCAKILKSVFPDTEVNGRHIGAYKRRLIQDEDILIPDRATMPINQMTEMAHGMVSTEDLFIYKCVVGSAKRSLKCFEFKFRAEDKDLVSEVDEWITRLQ